MKVHTLRALKDNFIYVVQYGPGVCAVVDPGEAEPVHKFLREHPLQLTHVLCTHHHLDHVGGVQELAKHYDCEVVGSRYDISQGRIPAASQVAIEAESFQLGDHAVAILEVPGHTLGQICYHFESAGILFPGDTLFSAGCGRLFEGTPEQMFKSLGKIAKLPATTRIYFGHEYTLRNLEFVLAREPRTEVIAYHKLCLERVALDADTTPTTVQTELDVNPFLRARTVAEFTDWREARNHF